MSRLYHHFNVNIHVLIYNIVMLVMMPPFSK